MVRVITAKTTPIMVNVTTEMVTRASFTTGTEDYSADPAKNNKTSGDTGTNCSGYTVTGTVIGTGTGAGTGTAVLLLNGHNILLFFCSLLFFLLSISLDNSVGNLISFLTG
jgi:hypothetical protein